MLTRDVGNLRNYFGRFAPSLLTTVYDQEIWAHYKTGGLTPDTVLTGKFTRVLAKVDLKGMLNEIEDVRMDEQARLLRIQSRN